ncbi:ABC transporter permease [uncultured Limosilactobacillus sp.]|uniref:ABC transporter permease n=1 Tax=uncultured Limosilactobacillus sp. TaxID=2837629 RepID=UPI0025FBDF07|nr:ABC transporter permease [uncultured Limosilactobacillus sp.]
MFLAIREIMHNKLHYGLIIGIVTLIGYLMIILTGLMLGLANENTAVIRDWDIKTVYLNRDADDNLGQSLITSKQVGKLNAHEALVGTVPVVMKRAHSNHANKQSIQFMGIDRQQFLYRHKLQITEGHRPQQVNEIVLDRSLHEKGYRIGNQVKFADQQQTYQVVGFVKNAKLNIAPLAIGSLAAWRHLKGTNDQFIASGVFSDQNLAASLHSQLGRYTAKEFIQKLPGYAAQNTTFLFMIGFLMVISLIVIAVFLYILTMQKLPEYAVLRAQGIPAATLVWATISEAIILMTSGVMVSLIITLVTSLVMPTNVPMLINWPLTILIGISLIILGTVGALLPVRIISKIDPLDAI